MAWITTDTDVACSLVVLKHVNGQTIPGYPKSYSILNAFSDYGQITENAWHKATGSERTTRLNAFKTYIGRLEDIIVDNVQNNQPTRPTTGTPGEIAEV